MPESEKARPEPIFFATPDELRAWLEEHHAVERELYVGYYKKGTGRPSITWPESVDQALCYGWIDGVRRSLGDDSYMIRFTPRAARSTWSAVNIGRVAELERMGLMRPAGHKAFEQRVEERSGIYSHEQRDGAALDPAAEQLLRANAAAWEFFQSQPGSYRKAAVWWVISAKREETRQRRLQRLIDDSAAGRTIRELTRPDKK